MYLPILPIYISIRIFLYSSPLLRLARVGPDAHTLPGFGKELAPQSVEKAKVRLTNGTTQTRSRARSEDC